MTEREQWSSFEQTISLMAKETPGKLSISIVDVENDLTIHYCEQEVLSLASVGKLFILGCLLEKCQQGERSLEDEVWMTKEDLVSGSGLLQYMKTERRQSVYDLAFLMVVVSDNTATNLLLKYIGGAPAVKQHLQALGIHRSGVNRRIAMTDEDIKMGHFADGCAADLTDYLCLMEDGKILDPTYLGVFNDMLRHQEYKNMFLKQMPLEEHFDEGREGTLETGSKTGFDGDTRADAGWIQKPDGKMIVYAIVAGGSGDTRYTDDNAAVSSMAAMGKCFYEKILREDRRETC